jgi:phage-related minor tail protein
LVFGSIYMKTDLGPAIEALRSELLEQEEAVNETKKMINALLRRMEKDPEFPEVESGQMQMRLGGTMRADQYYGKPFATAAQEFLERRKQACSADEVLKGLEQGGFDFKALGWKEKDRLRSLAISLAKNNQKFHKLPNNTFGLLAWYPNVTTERKE